MLKLKNIKKNYYPGENIVEALKAINIVFRENEFVAILGPSGCGKTTLLNIIGGLDQYTNGDLIINNKSTKEYDDKDWDTYRNHSIGFVFQTYNLIPHQTVLENVEIALTISGVSKEARRKKATEVLTSVGLSDQLNKKPNQLSGGQMQRVAIARALVNDPEIILADEPTGALDTETGIEVMEILKEISKKHLVIMVTHNPALAEKYSTRIINMLDGKITNDSSVPKSNGKKKAKSENLIKPSMSFKTAFILSLRNLISKKGRTILTAFAGSIGILGIALILAVSQGTTKYINNVQEDALTSYPISIEETSIDITSLMNAFMDITNSEINHDKDAVYKKAAIYDMVTALNDIESQENDLKSFKKYFEKELETQKISDAVTGYQYAYNLDLNIYTKDDEETIIKSDTTELLQKLMAEHMNMDLNLFNNNLAFGNMSDKQMEMMGGGLVNMNLWQEILPGNDGELINEVVKKQYDVVHGKWPSKYNEIVLVLDKNNELDDLTLYALGLETKENIDNLMKAAMNQSEVVKNDAKWSYEEIMNKDYRIILNSSLFSYDHKNNKYEELSSNQSGLKYLYDNAVKLKVVGIIRPNTDSHSNILSGSIAYINTLTAHVIKESEASDIIKAQQANTAIDILTKLPFKNNVTDLSEEEKELEFNKYIKTLNNKEKAKVYIDIMSVPSKKEIESFVNTNMQQYKRKDIEQLILTGLTENINIDKAELEIYIKEMSDEELNRIFKQSLEEQFKIMYETQTKQKLSQINELQLAKNLDELIKNSTAEDFIMYYDDILEFSENTYKENLAKMGYVDLDDPKTINIYASSFANKEIIESIIENYNEGKDELEQIKYTDLFGIMMSSITSIINAITYVLLAFVGISLIVSSIMIGVITLISVQERIKEIGILRAIGASKKNISSMFNAETIIIGFSSGAIGTIVTYILCVPINIVLHKVTGINNINAYLPIPAAISLIVISVLLSLISGIIPAKSAAKKEPVNALRTE